MFAGVPPEAASPAAEEALRVRAAEDATFAHWIRANVKEHRSPGHRVIFLSLKAPGEPPGDATDQQLYAIADLMDRYNQGCCVATYNQNLLFQDVRAQDVLSLYDALQPLQLTTPNIDSIADQICCPGLDFCNLASTASIPLAKDISERFSDPDELEDLGTLHVNMSGCVNACGHHHTGHIGILGVERAGAEAYQIKVGGHPGTDAAMPAAIGEIVGPSVTAEEVIPLIERLLDCYKRERTEGETFVETCRRIGVEPFKEAARE
jgi:sulfite reductase (NADPH) hemoprotein beta-component